MAGISVASTTSTSVTLYLSALQTAWQNGERTAYWYLGSANGGIPTESAYSKMETATIDDGVELGGEVTFRGLQPDTQYGVYCAIYHGSTFLADTEGYVTTDAEVEVDTWNLTKIDLGTLTSVYYTDLTFNLGRYQVYRYSFTAPYSGYVTLESFGNIDARVYLTTNPSFNYIGGEPFSYEVYEDGTRYSIYHRIEKDTTYYLYFRGFDEDDTGLCDSGFWFDADQGATISKWDWYSSNGSASANVTLNSYYALYKDNPTSDFSHLVWMDMVDKAWEIIKVKTNWWDSGYADKNTTKNLTQNSDGLYELTAVAFNSLRNNIELIGNRSDVLGRKTGIGQVFAQNASYPVKAEYFLTLADYINDCIDNL